VREDARLQPYFNILAKDADNEALQSVLRRDMRKKGLDAALLDRPDAAMPGQTGSTSAPLKPSRFDKGLRYCLDTAQDPSDWRRRVYETCFECPTLGLKSVCLSCARLCKRKYRLRPYIRKRQKGGDDSCDCDGAGTCYCRYTVARAAFDRICGDDSCIGPNQLRALLQSLRAPFLVEGAGTI
jgi:hypothetical protein